MRPGTGSLYAAVQRLVDDGLISVVSSEDGGRRGNTYKLTPAGQTAAGSEAERLRGVLALAAQRNVVSEPEGA